MTAFSFELSFIFFFTNLKILFWQEVLHLSLDDIVCNKPNEFIEIKDVLVRDENCSVDINALKHECNAKQNCSLYPSLSDFFVNCSDFYNIEILHECKCKLSLLKLETNFFDQTLLNYDFDYLAPTPNYSELFCSEDETLINIKNVTTNSTKCAIDINLLKNKCNMKTNCQILTNSSFMANCSNIDDFKIEHECKGKN